MNKHVWLGAKLLIAIVIFWIVSTFVDLGEAIELILSAHMTYLLLAVLLTVPFALLESARWNSVMRALGQRFPFKTSLIYTLVGWFFNNISPANTGQDVFKAVQMTRVGVVKGLAIKSVIIYRFASFWSLLLVVAAALPFAFVYAGSSWNKTILTLIFASGCALMVLALSLDAIRPLVPTRFARDLLFKFLSPLSQLRMALFRSNQSVRISVLGLAVHLWRVLIVYVLALSLGIHTTYLELVLFVPLALLVAMLPVTIGDWGTREAAFAFFLPWVGISAEQAVGLSVLFGLYRICNGIPGGIVWLFVGKTAYSVPNSN